MLSAATAAAGSLRIIGLGPGDAAHITPATAHALHGAHDVLGYTPYVTRARQLWQQQALAADEPRWHPSDNRQELARARHALALAAQGRRVVLASSGDPGVFAMASAVFEAIDTANAAEQAAWQALDIQVLPGITAMLAAAARAGAPLGHDFCCINLSDNLKPWAVIEQRLQLALAGDFALGLYNPRSHSRPEGFARVLALLRAQCEPERLLIFARAVATPDERLHVCALAQATPDLADMRTVVLVGNRLTRRCGPGGRWVYTPRYYDAPLPAPPAAAPSSGGSAP